MTDGLIAARTALGGYAERILPRILTQLDRDPTSPTYGCADRNWWHYKIRDFPSIILQQAGEAVWTAAQTAGDHEAEALRSLAAGACRFWNARATKYGAFEEYYPYERGYPPLAFSTLSVAKLAHAGAVDVADVGPGLEVAARQLRRRFEAEALNQQAAGLAALAWVRRLRPDLVTGSDLDRLTKRTLGMQHDEGWFPEYGGPDTGYLSVTLDCLWDAFDASGDERLLVAADKAVGFIASMTSQHRGSPGMLNSRNTDYVVPYGLVRSASADRAVSEPALATVAVLFPGVGDPGHPLNAVDDRYLCHYIGVSSFRAVRLLDTLQRDVVVSAGAQATQHEWWPGAGYWHVNRERVRLAGALRKGGVVTGAIGDDDFADLGWRVESSSGVLVSHWWSDHWSVTEDHDRAVVRGTLVPVKPTQSTPVRHVGLRVVSALFGERIIAVLKRRLIFRSASSRCTLERRIEVTGNGVEIRDGFTGLPDGAIVTRAPRASMRHVASADSAHPEDLQLCRAPREERVERRGDRCEIVTRYG